MPHLLAVCGSLQRTSANLELLHALRACAPDGTDVEVFADLADVPPFNPDREDDPSPVLASWRAAVAGADAVVVATPEYAHGYPGVLKNALDWLVGGGDLYEKPVAVLNAARIASRGVVARDTLAEVLRTQGADVRHVATVVLDAEAGTYPERDLVAVLAVLDALT